MFRDIPHYYGDSVRILFVVMAALLLLALPFYPDVLPFTPAVQTAGALLLIVCAALTNPHARWVMLTNAVCSMIGVVIAEAVAIDAYQQGDWTLLLIREVLAIAFLFAGYLSIKTVRAMATGHIGAEESGRAEEFNEE